MAWMRPFSIQNASLPRRCKILWTVLIVLTGTWAWISGWKLSAVHMRSPPFWTLGGANSLSGQSDRVIPRSLLRSETEASVILAPDVTGSALPEPSQTQQQDPGSPATEPVSGAEVCIDDFDHASMLADHYRNELPFTLGLLWMGPVFSGSGYGMTSLEAIVALQATGLFSDPTARLRIAHFGDIWRNSAKHGLGNDLNIRLDGLYDLHPVQDGEYWHSVSENSIVVCHSQPSFWAGKGGSCLSCPPAPVDKSLCVVGRTTFETDRVPSSWPDMLNKMREVWISTEFNREVFTGPQVGVAEEKVKTVPETVNVSLWNPCKYQPFPMPLQIGNIVWGEASQETGGSGEGGADAGATPPAEENLFVFLSIFKWEERKGWDILLRAYAEEFTVHDPVILIIVTHKFMGAGPGTDRHRLRRWIKSQPWGKGMLQSELPRLHIITDNLDSDQIPRLFRSANAFVLPSHGEGFGRPNVEAMAMGLPLVATNWSGMMDYLDETVGYPIEYEMVTCGRQCGNPLFTGHRWAEPSVEHLRQQMRAVASNPEEARARGRAARQRVIERFSHNATIPVLVQRIRELQQVCSQPSAEE